MRDPDKNVTFVFRCYEKESVDLKIRLKYDGLQQSQFFEAILKLYIQGDPLMTEVVSHIKQEERTMGKRKIKNSKKEIITGQELMKDLALSDQDRQDIFDVIEFATNDKDNHGE